MKITTITSRKGGVSKTTTAVTLAHGLALQGKRTLALGLDPQGHVAASLGYEPTGSAFTALTDWESRQFICLTDRENLDIVPGNLRNNVIQAFHQADGVDLPQILDGVQAFADGYDHLIIDTPPSGYLQEIGIYLADTLVIPAKLDYLSVSGVSDTLAASEEIGKRYGRSPSDIIVLPTFEKNTNESARNLGDLRAAYGGKVATPIPDRVEVLEAVSCALTLWEYKPKGDAAQAYNALLERIEGGS